MSGYKLIGMSSGIAVSTLENAATALREYRLRSIAVPNKKPPAQAGGSCSNSKVQLTG